MTKKIAIQNPENVCFNCLKETNKLHKINISELGYGSDFDGISTKIHLCNDCFLKTNPEWWKLEIVQCDFDKEDNYGFVKYKYEEEIFNFVDNMPLEGRELFCNRYARGANAPYMDSQDWIDYELGILPHKQCKKYGLYSPEEINAYKERFSVCQHPVNLVFNDLSCSCKCPFGAYGEYGQIPGLPDISKECYECKYFEKRKYPIKTIQYEDWKDYKIYYIAKLKEEEFKNKFER